MARPTALFYDSDIAMIEHELIRENDILEWMPERLQWYLAGVHDLAEKIIEKMREKGEV